MFWVLTRAHQNWWERIESQHLFLRFPIFSPFFLVRSGRRLVWHACRLDLCQSMCHPVPNSWSVCQQHRLGKARGPPATAAGTAGSGREPIFALPSPRGPLPWQVSADLQNLKGNKGNDRTQAPKGGTAIERISLIWSGVLINCFKELAIFQDLLRWREKVKERERPLRLIVLLLLNVLKCHRRRCPDQFLTCAVLAGLWKMGSWQRIWQLPGWWLPGWWRPGWELQQPRPRLRRPRARLELGRLVPQPVPAVDGTSWTSGAPGAPRRPSLWTTRHAAKASGSCWDRLRMAEVGWDSDQFHQSIDWNQYIYIYIYYTKVCRCGST